MDMQTDEGAVTKPLSGTPRPAPPLSAADAERVQRYQQQLLRAMEQRDRNALQCTKQEVLHAAYGHAVSLPLRLALRELAWRMAGLLLPKRTAH